MVYNFLTGKLLLDCSGAPIYWSRSIYPNILIIHGYVCGAITMLVKVASAISFRSAEALADRKFCGNTTNIEMGGVNRWGNKVDSIGS